MREKGLSYEASMKCLQQLVSSLEEIDPAWLEMGSCLQEREVFY